MKNSNNNPFTLDDLLAEEFVPDSLFPSDILDEEVFIPDIDPMDDIIPPTFDGEYYGSGSGFYKPLRTIAKYGNIFYITHMGNLYMCRYGDPDKKEGVPKVIYDFRNSLFYIYNFL